jgi:hypothetical protein
LERYFNKRSFRLSLPLAHDTTKGYCIFQEISTAEKKGWFAMAESEVARLMREIDKAYEAAQRGLTGLASGTARHDFINAREEHIALCHQELTALVGPAQAIALVAGIYFEGEQSNAAAALEKPIGEEHHEPGKARINPAHSL